MRNLLAASALCVLAALPAAASDDVHLVTILTAPEPQTQLMAMALNAV